MPMTHWHASVIVISIVPVSPRAEGTELTGGVSPQPDAQGLRDLRTDLFRWTALLCDGITGSYCGNHQQALLSM